MADRDNGILLALLGAGAVLLLLPRSGGGSVLSIFSPTTPSPSLTPTPTGSGTIIDVTPISVSTSHGTPLPTAQPVPVTPLPVVTTTALPVAQPLPIYLPAVGVAAVGSTLQDVKTIVEGSFSVVKAGGTIVKQTDMLGAQALANLGVVMQVLGVVALVVDMGFVIASNVPDAQKAIDTALDAAMIVCLFIPVYGWIISIVLAVVRFIFDLFAGKLFGSLTHEQREALETAAYAEHLHPIFPAIAHCYAPRELLRVLIDWGSGSCGGTQSVAMVTGLHNTPTQGVDLYFGDDGCYYHTGVNAGITFDQQAQWLATKGQTSDFFAVAQAGISTTYRNAFNAQMFNVVTARCVVYANMAAQGLTLDDMDKIADEYRRTDTLDRVAAIFGWDSWRGLFASILQPQWSAYVASKPTGGSLNDFARTLGYSDAIALRDAAFAGYMPVGLRVVALEDAIRSLEVELSTSPTLASMFVGKGPSLMPTPMPTYTPDQNLLAYLQALEARQVTLTQACASTQAANPYGSGYVPVTTGGP